MRKIYNSKVLYGLLYNKGIYLKFLLREFLVLVNINYKNENFIIKVKIVKLNFYIYRFLFIQIFRMLFMKCRLFYKLEI